MRRFVYAPDVQAFVSTENHGTIEVTNDIVSGSVNRVLNATSTAELVLNSPNRKYLRVFKPMDRIAIYLTRTKPVLVFTGYLDRAPLDQLYPAPVTLRASCPLKRLLYTYWDPSLSYTQQWFAAHGWAWDIGTGNIIAQTGQSLWNLDLQNSIAHMIREVMNDVGHWPIGENGQTRNTVHILGLPKAFLTKTQAMIAQAVPDMETDSKNTLAFLNSILGVNGVYSDPFSSSDGTTGTPTDNQVDDNPLPANLAKSYHAAIYGPAVGAAGFAGAVTKEAAKDGISISQVQANAAATIYATMTTAGYNAKASAAWVAVAYAESTLIPDRAQAGGGGGSGLFQLTSGGFFGPTGILAQVAKSQDPSFTGDPEQIGSGVGDNGAAASNAAYNALAILHNGNISDPVNTVNGSNDPIGTIVSAFLRPLDPSGDNTRGNTIFPALQRAITTATSTASSTASTADDGAVGDVRVGDPSFLVAKPPNLPVGYTFKIKDNPYGDDNMIFRAKAYDSSLDPQEIEIYVPGAKDKSSPQAAQWTNKEVAVETSANLASRFQSVTGPSNVLLAPSGPNKDTIATKVVQVAMSQVGTTEQGGYNAGPKVSAYDAAAHIAPPAAWCVAFVQWVFQQAGRPLSESSMTANTGVLQAAYPNTSTPQPGDIVTWSDSHSGIVVKVSGDTISTVEGNAGVNSNAVVENQWTLSNPQIVDGAPPTFNRVPGIGLAAADANLASGAQSSQTAGATGVQLNETTVAQLAESVNIGTALTFPLVSSVAEAQNFTGSRALQNDVPLMDWVKFMTTASARSFQTLPNGDFMAFYPDYFNWSNQAPYWRISDIETMDLTIDISDETMATHVFTVSDSFDPNGSIDLWDQLNSTVASVESIDTFRDLISVGSDFDPAAFMQRYGARPMVQDVVEIKNSFLQFMYGWMTFLQQWATMFYATPTFTFMPELYPGGLIEFSSKDLVMYINSVTHTFDRSAGFTTSAELIAPSTTTKQYSFPMVLTNGYSGASTKAKK